MTPEGRTKAAIDKRLQAAAQTKYHKPVQNGMGAPTLDYTLCSRGRHGMIEAKAPGEKPTARQQITIDEWRAAGSEVFVIDSADCYDMGRLLAWLHLE